MIQNQILLRGRLAGCPSFSHQSHGKRFYRTPIEVPRLSGTVDRLDLLLPESLLPAADPDTPCEVTGQVRSFNDRSGIGRKLIITVFTRTLTACSLPPENTLRLSGFLCKPPIFRRTPLGREICDLMVAVPRGYGRSDYLPCITWGSSALAASHLSVRDQVMIEGRLQSRGYIKVLPDRQEERVAYEISVTDLCPGTDT